MSEPTTPLAGAYGSPEGIGALQRRCLVVAAAGVLLSLLGLFLDREQLLRSYLVSWLLWCGVALGCLAVLFLSHLARGEWGMIVRRTLEAASRTLPLLLLLFVPIAIGLGDLYTWADPEIVAGDELLRHKARYLNRTGFIVRAVAYFVLWYGCAWVLGRMSARQDATGDASLSRKMRTFAAPALALYALAATFASFDWLMSLDPHWFSSIFGVYFIGGHGVSAFAFLIIVALFLSRREPLKPYFKVKHFHDYGKLLFAFVMLWTYFAISQLLIIWSGNLPEEITWYLRRTRGGWDLMAVGLLVLHFAVPFLLLLSAGLKKSPRRLAWIAVWLLAMRWMDLYWQAAPAFHESLTVHFLDAATLAAVGGVWVAWFLRELQRRPLLPVKDHNVQEALGHE